MTTIVDNLTRVRTVEEISAALREQGLRVTPQRQCIIELLRGDDEHPTVDSLYDAARDVMETISRRTVYQTVHDLEALGEVRLLDVGTGSVRVDPNVEDEHHHLVCVECGRVRDVPATTDDLRVPARYRREFSVDSIDVIFRGRCASCS